MVLVRGQGVGRSSFREEKKHIQSGKLKQQLPEQAVEASKCQMKEGGGEGKENDRVTKASLTHCHTLSIHRPHFLWLDPFPSEPAPQ